MSETRSKMIDAARIKKALIVLPNWMGDAVMAVPAISRIRDILPSAHVTVLGLSHICELFQESPYIDETRVYSKSLLATVNDIKKYGYDIAILFPNSFRSALIAHLARIPLRCGYNRDGRGFMLNLPVTVDLKIKGLHQAEYYLNLVGMAFSGEHSCPYRGTKEDENNPPLPVAMLRSNGNPAPLEKGGKSPPILKGDLGGLWGKGGFERGFSGETLVSPMLTKDSKQKEWLHLSQDEIQRGKEMLSKNNIPPDFLIIGINPGAAYGSAKRWYPERFARLSNILSNKYNAKIIVFGGKQEQDISEQIVSASQVSILNMAGKTSVRELMAMIKHCRLFITNDSGPMHIAAALGVPVVAIFGSTDPSKTSPLGEQHIVIKKDIACSPCFLRKCYKDLLCMDLISVDDVMEGVERVSKGIFR
ncbi:MAG: lipopolysaccharide heptosyltransferase II [Nitrospirae bacterium]|nr:lipopolysaccharide heptosyltransferase II [Nitrospirota bacterium]